MTTNPYAEYQYLRKIEVLAAGSKDALDLSEHHVRYRVLQSDEESPNTADIRLYNLKEETVNTLIEGGEYSRVILQAGYESSYGIIFDGTIKQFRTGKENSTDRYLDILAAVGDEEYNFAVVSTTVAAGSTSHGRITEISKHVGVGTDIIHPTKATGGVLPRGKVLWGMARDLYRKEARLIRYSWSLKDGKVVMIPLKGYRDNEVVVLTSQTGLIGSPDQTDQGIVIKCLTNPLLDIGCLVQIDNKSINKTTQQEKSKLPAGQDPYNSRAGLYFPADLSADGYYKLYVVEHFGDSRGNEFYSNLTALAVDISAGEVVSNG